MFKYTIEEVNAKTREEFLEALNKIDGEIKAFLTFFEHRYIKAEILVCRKDINENSNN